MIEVDLRPDRDRRRGRRRLSLPSPERLPGWQEVRADPWHWLFVACAVLVPLLVAGAWYVQRSEVAGLEARLERVRADSARLAERASLGDSLAARRDAIAERIERVRSLDRDRYVWPHLMDEMSRALPGGAWLTSIETERPSPGLRVRVEGMARTPVEITDYVRALEASPFVGGVEIRGSRRVALDRGYAQSFRLLVAYRSPPAGARRTRPLVSGEG